MKNMLRLLRSLFFCALVTLPAFVHAGDDENDEYGLFYFDASDMDFSDGAIYPRACVSSNDGDYVVFDLFQANHNQCKRRSMGTYKQDLMTFIVSFAKQQKQDNDQNNGNGYEVDEDILGYLQCQQYYYNNNMFYLKLGCRDSTGKGFQINAYSDAYCTTKTSQNYNLGIDISSLRVSFESCKSCKASSRYNQYANDGNGNNQGGYYYQQEYEYVAYETPLCSAAYNYKENCGGSCKRAARKVASSRSRNGGGFTGEGFSPVGKFFLWVMSFSAIFFLLASLAQRKKMSKTDAVLEEAAIKSAGVDKKYIPRIFVGIAIFIILLILFKRKVLTWFSLTAVNVALLAYWVQLKNKADEKSSVSGGDYQMYGNNGGIAA